MTTQSSLRFHWDPAYRVEWWNRGHVLQLQTLGGEVSVSLSPGQSYAWKTYSGDKLIESASFDVSDQFEYRSLGRNGEDGIRDRTPADGKAGTDGGSLKVDLSREGCNLKLQIQEQGRTRRFLLADRDHKFLINVRGGSGGKGSDGLDQQGAAAAAAGNGGDSGWGGHIDITVHQIPWREALELDVSAGTPGAGGRGGSDQGTSSEGQPLHMKYPDGRPGRPGKPGTVTTHIQP
ncbi:hypothetical protein JST97_26150 [bacterium]|nr:hypothetical protein [bacterium]